MMVARGGGGGGGGGDEKKPRKWQPDDKAGKLIFLPRSKGAGGKHFIPANWLDRLLAMSVEIAGTLGRVEQIMADLHDLVGNDAPLEISFYRIEHKSASPYVSLTDSSQRGFDQVLTSLRERFREWDEVIFPHGQASSGDGGGREIDMPVAPPAALAMRLANAAGRIITFFDRWLGGADIAREIPIAHRNAILAWRDMKALLMAAIMTLMLRAPINNSVRIS